MINHFMILRKDGQPLYIHNQEKRTQKLLISGFLSSFEIFAGNLHQSHVSKIELDDYTYFYSVRDPIISVVEGSPRDEVESRIFQIIAERLAREFIQKYSKVAICDWNGLVDVFQDFHSYFETISNEITGMLQQSHQDFITKYFVEAANDDNILGLVVFDLENDVILASDIPSDFSEKDFESFGSMLFSFINRLSITLKSGEIDEILIRAKNYWIGGFRKGIFAVFMLFHQEYFGKVIPDFVKNAIPNSK